MRPLQRSRTRMLKTRAGTVVNPILAAGCRGTRMIRYTKAPSCSRCGSATALDIRAVAGILLLVAACGGGDSGGNGIVEPPDPPRAVAIAISPESASLTFIGQTATFTASLTDQHGASFSGTVTWSSDEPGVFTVNPQGVVTSVANGWGTLRAAFQNLSATIIVKYSLKRVDSSSTHRKTSRILLSTPYRNPLSGPCPSFARRSRMRAST